MSQASRYSGQAWALSLAIHAAFVAVCCWAWPGGEPLHEKSIDVRVRDLGPIDVVMLDAPTPRRLPGVAAMPLTDSSSNIAFEPIIPVAATTTTKTPAFPRPTPPPVAATAKPSSKPAGAATSFFGVPAVGKSVVFVVDRSSSMGLDRRLDRAVREVAASLDMLDAATHFQVIAYARTPTMLHPSNGLAPAERMAIATIQRQLLGLVAEGGTDHVRALKAALLLQPDVIYFLTDEDDLTPGDVAAVTAYNRGRSSIHAICLVPSISTTPLVELARRNRGEFRVAR